MQIAVMQVTQVTQFFLFINNCNAITEVINSNAIPPTLLICDTGLLLGWQCEQPKVHWIWLCQIRFGPLSYVVWIWSDIWQCDLSVNSQIWICATFTSPLIDIGHNDALAGVRVYQVYAGDKYKKMERHSCHDATSPGSDSASPYTSLTWKTTAAQKAVNFFVVLLHHLVLRITCSHICWLPPNILQTLE